MPMSIDVHKPNHKFPSALFANIRKTLMIQNMKLGTNDIEAILFGCSSLYCLLLNHNSSDCTAFCTILEALDVGTAEVWS